MSSGDQPNPDFANATRRLGSIVDEKYRLKRVLGIGGMGIVYDAEHQFLGRPVALKILHPRYEDTLKAAQRFLKEARAAGSIGHPAIIRVLDAGFVDATTPYLVMERLEGENLDQRIQRIGGLSVLEGAVLLRALMRGLEAAHSKGIIHCDLKPANVYLVNCTVAPECIKILDFGISKMAADSRSSKSESGRHVLGTPDYMAPEQVQGADVEERTDIYAAGAMMYEAFTGKPPYADRARVRVFMRILRDPIPPVRGAIDPIPSGFAGLLKQMMAKEISRRPPSAAEVVRAIDRLQLIPESQRHSLTSFHAASSQKLRAAAAAAHVNSDKDTE